MKVLYLLSNTMQMEIIVLVVEMIKPLGYGIQTKEL